MKNYLLIIAIFFVSAIGLTQETDRVLGVIINSSDNTPLESVNIVNLNDSFLRLSAGGFYPPLRRSSLHEFAVSLENEFVNFFY